MSHRHDKDAPTDKEAEHAYTQIMLRAEQAGLIAFAYSGVATLAIPSEQRKQGIREQVLETHCLNETKGKKA